MKDDLTNLPRWEGPERRVLPRTGPEWLWFGKNEWVTERVAIFLSATESEMYGLLENAYQSAFRLGYRQGQFDTRLELG